MVRAIEQSELEQSLVSSGAVTAEQWRAIALPAAGTGDSILIALERAHGIDPHAVVATAAQLYDLPVAADHDWPRTRVLEDRLSLHFLRDTAAVPLGFDESGALRVAAVDPDMRDGLNALRLAVRRPLHVMLATYADVMAALSETSVPAAPSDNPATALGRQAIEHLDDLALEAPIVELVDRLLQDAVLRRATDLHIEQRRSRVVLRHRIDGLLQNAGSLDNETGHAVISRVKIISGLNISERRLPQDGQSRVRISGRDFDLRVVTMPTVHGESAAIRLLSTIAEIPELGSLGLAARDERVLRGALRAPNGLIIVTGPTGSGKTTTLAACLGLLNEPQRKLVTIEDPVEYQIEGVNQVQVKPDIGVTFTSALRALLRYDPDTMMIGEIRDSETAGIAVHAALTGHLVLSSLHTSSAAGAITRLLDMGVEAYLLSSSLRCVVGQRLVRRLCRHCRRAADVALDIPPVMLAGSAYAGIRHLPSWEATGCDRCSGTGYFGRLAIFEVLETTPDLAARIVPGTSAMSLHEAARCDGMSTMALDGIVKCLAGETTISEVVRVVLDS